MNTSKESLPKLSSFEMSNEDIKTQPKPELRLLDVTETKSPRYFNRNFKAYDWEIAE